MTFARLGILGLTAALAAWGAAGCDQKLETGYVPHRLNASDAERRGYYAPPFAPAPSKDSGVGGMPNLSHP